VVYRDDPRQLPFDAASAAGPLLRLADAEAAHNAGLRAAAWGLFPRETRPDPPELGVTLWGRRFHNPLGALSAPVGVPAHMRGSVLAHRCFLCYMQHGEQAEAVYHEADCDCTVNGAAASAADWQMSCSA